MITEQEILELTAFYSRESMQPGDLTIKQLVEQLGGSENNWRAKLSRGVVPPGWRALKVYSTDAQAEIWVLRKSTTR